MLRKIIIIFISIILLLFCFIFSLKEENILYSWSMNEVNDSTNLIKLSKEFEIKTIYQEFSSKYLNGTDNIFLENMENNEIDVYYLTGDPTYDSTDIKNKIDLVVNYNSKSTYKIKGIVFDIEPYLEDDFDDYDGFVEEISIGYKYAKQKGIYYVIVIPYWLDKKDESALEKLIENCDEISVMNYHIKNTAKNIKEEIKYVKKYNKNINTIYEVNADNNNSFSSYKEIDRDFIKIKLNCFNIKKAYHYYGSMINN